ncbi:hypothetical protein GCM10018781_39890 [Kitasatospora indigofera]|uniref:Uncharacterized protein n=1 Tax=Kitasatospora indigofera TaxID=67307 RepID=A0A919KVG6_9ACTN|nr:hypothetical protein [Kitasatospora indigofera]GHH74022.1 hypothetical protein GCM10018781_39890 [Kitasatospora indigofera]
MVLTVTPNTAPGTTRRLRRPVPDGSRVATAVHPRAGGAAPPRTVRETGARSAAALPPLAGRFDPPTDRRSRTAVPVQEIHVPRHQ